VPLLLMYPLPQLKTNLPKTVFVYLFMIKIWNYLGLSRI